MTSVSVLVPIYNVEKYLKQCLESIINQTLKDIEIICINDGSTDSSLDIIQFFQQKDDRIKIINKKNTGYGNSMNLGLEAATGEYIGIVESDDWAEQDMFETLYNEAKTNDLDVMRGEFYFYTTNPTTNKYSNINWVVHDKIYAPRNDMAVFFQQPSIWANIYKRSFLNENKIRFLETPGASYQDTAFSFKVYAQAKRFKMISKPVLHYRIDGGSSSFQATTKVYCVCDEYHEIWNYVKKQGLYEKYRYLIPHLQYNGYTWNYNRLAPPYNEEFLEIWKKEFKELFRQGNISQKEFSEKEYNHIIEMVNSLKDANAPLLSIIVPVYNMEKYLKKCMDSIINQTLTNIEIICVNDGSTDSSLKILNEYAEKDKRIIIINKENGGLSSARNAGMKLASSDIITFVDSDDWIESDTYEIAIPHMLDADLVSFGTRVVGDAMMNRRNADMEYYRVKQEGLCKLNDDIKFGMDVAAWNKIYNLDIIRKYNIEFPEGLLYEDYAFFWCYISVIDKCYFIPDFKYNYLRREDSIMGKTFKGNPRSLEHLEIGNIVYDFMKKENIIDENKNALKRIFVNCFWFSYFNSNKIGKIKTMLLGTKYVKKTNISGDTLIDALAKHRYHVVIALGGGKIGKLINKIKNPSKSRKNNRSEIILDFIQNSGNNTIYGAGIKGGNVTHVDKLHKNLICGYEYSATISLWDTESAIVSGIVINPDRCIWGTSMFDGFNTYCITVDIHPPNDTIQVYAINVNTKEDLSVHCKLLRIERRKL